MLVPQLAITIWSPENGSFSGAWLLAFGAFFSHLPSSFLPLCPGLCSKQANLPNEPNFKIHNYLQINYQGQNNFGFVSKTNPISAPPSNLDSPARVNLSQPPRDKKQTKTKPKQAEK
jgi:hypothetical protein